MEQRLFGLTTRDFRSLAFQLAVKNKIKHPFNTESQLAGEDWLHGFRQRHPELCLRIPEATSAARAAGFNRVAVSNFFAILQAVKEAKDFPASRTYNVDETSAVTVQTKKSKVLALKGRRQVGCLTSAERGVLTTACVCMSATGYYIPPMLIFPRARLTESLKTGAPPETLFSCNGSGWMTMTDFNTWFNHFLEHSRPTAAAPVLLILDGHVTHTKNIAFLKKAQQNHVTVVSLPPHCSHRMQPLDVSFMAPLKSSFSKAIEAFLRRNPGKVVTDNDASALFGEAYLKTATASVAQSGFKATGIVPFNQFIFTAADFAPSDVTDVPEAMDQPAEDDALTILPHPEHVDQSAELSIYLFI
ncbi:tigger transposable element-derived protein 6-like [Armigeres subalbatus]|uniref:tigger transposable element-derived protein 6-like n=1 Tax=Armigeres subalbatus TaxID=124917 RepID=UPI002ED33584